MLHAIKDVRQEPGAGRRRWFESDGLELIVWLDPADRVSGFQLCYDLGPGARALTWRAGEGFAHAVVDTGDHSPLRDETPVLQPEGGAPWRHLIRLFDERSAPLDPDLRQLVRDKLKEGMAAAPRRGG